MIFEMLKKYFFVFSLTFIFLVNAFAASKNSAQAKVPAWFTNKEVAYPDSFYITALGEGESEASAKVNALSQISLYFNTSTEVSNELLRLYNESDGTKYSFSEQTQILQTAHISSEAEFFCLEFTKPFVEKKQVYVLAYIEREKAFSVYREEIRQNSLAISGLHKIAQGEQNPLLALKAATRSVQIANLNSALIKNARIVKSIPDDYFFEENELYKKSYELLNQNKNNMIFSIQVDGDFNFFVQTKISSILEGAGYALYAGDAKQKLKVRVQKLEQETPAGIFVSLEISCLAFSDSTGEEKPYFSYSHIMEKKGARSSLDANRRAYLALCEELDSSFKTEFERAFN